MAIYSGFSHEKWVDLSIAMLNYQRVFQAPKSPDFLPTFWAHHLCLVVRWADGSKLEARSGTEKRNGRAQGEMAIAMGEVLGFKKNGLFH